MRNPMVKTNGGVRREAIALSLVVKWEDDQTRCWLASPYWDPDYQQLSNDNCPNT